MYRRYVKRIIDVILSLVGLILASWLYLLIMIAIEIDDPGPVFFSQKRVGIHKKYFQLYKFRSIEDVHATRYAHASSGESGAVHHTGGEIPAQDIAG